MAKGYTADAPGVQAAKEAARLREVVTAQHEAMAFILESLGDRTSELGMAVDLGKIAMRQAVAAIPELEDAKPAGVGEVERILREIAGNLSQLDAAIRKPGFQATEEIERTAADRAMVASELHTKIMRLSWEQQSGRSLAFDD